MFLLHFLPDWLLSGFVNTVLVAGAVLTVISYFTTWIPFVTQYRVPAQVAGLILLTAGVYFKGGASAESQWRARVAEQQQKIQIAEVQSRAANRQLSEEIQKNQKLNKDIKDAVQADIRANAGKMDGQCTVDSVAIQLHNSASRNQVPRSTR
jgi:hypothetical protein